MRLHYLIAEANQFCEVIELTRIFEVLDFEIGQQKEKLEKHMRITTVVIESKNAYKEHTLNSSRQHLIRNIIAISKVSDIILLPAGYFSRRIQSKLIIKTYAKLLQNSLLKFASSAVICLGMDFDHCIDQIAFAVSAQGLIAIGRKFAPTKSEQGYIRQASSPFDTEYGYSRTFKAGERNFYLAVCYDCFGVRHMKVENPGIDITLVLSHRFQPHGQENSGEVDFVRKGVAGASQQWNCPTFVSSTFYDRSMPENWPTGILWGGEARSVKTFKYSENKLQFSDRKTIHGKHENAICISYDI